MTEEIYLVKFETKSNYLLFIVLGSSKVAYKVTFPRGMPPRCACPDHSIRKNTCKHIYFVCGKVLHIDPEVWDEIDDIVSISDKVLNNYSHLASEHVLADEFYKQKYEDALSGKKVLSDRKDDLVKVRNEECAVCLSDIDTKEELRKNVIVCTKCHNGVHVICWNKWKQVNNNGKCVYCRTKITDKANEEHHVKSQLLQRQGWGILLA